jgi:hypothetical protein
MVSFFNGQWYGHKAVSWLAEKLLESPNLFDRSFEWTMKSSSTVSVTMKGVKNLKESQNAALA